MQATLAVEKHHLGEPTSVRIEVGGELFALIALNPKRFPQQLCDLVLERTFTVSNNWENGSVVLSGYKTDQPAGEDKLYPSCANILFFTYTLVSFFYRFLVSLC